MFQCVCRTEPNAPDAVSRRGLQHELADIRLLMASGNAYFDELPITSVEQHLSKMLAILGLRELVIIALFHDPALVYQRSQQSVRHHH